MQCSIILVVLAITFARSLSQRCEVVESQHECGGYCYGAVKPVLEYLAILQKRVESCEAKQPAYTQSKIVHIEEKLDTLARQMAVQQEVEKIFRTADTLSKLALMDDKLEALRNQTAALQELEKRSQSRLQRLDHFTKIGSKYYFIQDTAKGNRWHVALERCREMGAHLLSLQSKDEMEAFRGILKKEILYWTDLNDLETGGEFISATTGSKGTFIHWAKDQPNSLENPEHCVALIDSSSSSFGMHDYPCDTKATFICEASFD